MKTYEIILSTLMPISSDASRSCAVARMALPTLVFCTIQVISNSSGIVTAITTMYLMRISIEPMVIDPCGNTLDLELGADPLVKIPMFWRMKLTPTAVINGANFGALRNRRYASFSMVALNSPQNAMAKTPTTASQNHPAG